MAGRWKSISHGHGGVRLYRPEPISWSHLGRSVHFQWVQVRGLRTHFTYRWRPSPLGRLSTLVSRSVLSLSFTLLFPSLLVPSGPFWSLGPCPPFSLSLFDRHRLWPISEAISNLLFLCLVLFEMKMSLVCNDQCSMVLPNQPTPQPPLSPPTLLPTFLKETKQNKSQMPLTAPISIRYQAANSFQSWLHFNLD